MIRGIIPLVKRRAIVPENAIKSAIGARGIAVSLSLRKKKMPDRPPLVDESEFTEAFLCGSGPGGQKINKTSSAVQLRHLPTGIVLKVQATRSRAQNRKIAREMLALKVEEIEKGDQSRVAVVKATKVKRKSSKMKKSNRKYKLLEEAKNKGATVTEEVEEDDAEGGEDEEGELVEEVADGSAEAAVQEKGIEAGMGEDARKAS